MKATTLFKTAAVLFFLFAIGHTVAVFGFKPPTQEASAVRESMNTVHFEFGGRIFSYGGFYRGFGISITVSLLLDSFLAWFLSKMAKRGSHDFMPIAWALLIQQIIGFGLAWIYFGIPALVFSALACLLIAAATLVAHKETSSQA